MSTSRTKVLARAVLAAAALGMSSAGLAQSTEATGTDAGTPMHGGPMGGMGYGMMGCPDGAAYPGMGMGGMGMGPGMMGMGPGMMGPGMGGAGMGFGQGMMGMGGPGMMGTGLQHLGLLNLSDDQRQKINAIQDNLRKQEWSLTGKIMDEQARLRDLYLADQPDPKKVGAVVANIGDLRRQTVEAQVQAMNQINNVLTKEQQAQLKQLRRGGPMYGRGAPESAPNRNVR